MSRKITIRVETIMAAVNIQSFTVRSAFIKQQTAQLVAPAKVHDVGQPDMYVPS